MERLKQSRDKLQSRFRDLAQGNKDDMTGDRSIVDELMREELQGLQKLLDKPDNTLVS